MKLLDEIILFGLRKNWRGFGFIVKKLYSSKIITKTKYNSLVRANPYEKIDNEILQKGYFDDDVYKALSANINEKSIYWDIGANIGIHLINLKKNYPKLMCYAFEPHYKAFAELVENVKLNKLDGVNAFLIGVDSKTTIRSVFTTAGNLGLTGFSESEGANRDLSILAASFSIDSLIEEFKIPSPDIIKIDTEGNEFKILQGAEKLLTSGALRSIVFEANRDFHDIEKLLTKSGYKVTKLSASPNYLASKFPPHT